MDALSGVTFTPFELAPDGIGRFGDLWWSGLRGSAALTAAAPATMRVHTVSLMSSKRGRNGMIYTEIGSLEADAV